MVITAVSAIALMLLGVAGLAKVIDPEPTHGALAAAGLPAGAGIARGLGGIEIVSAITGLTLGAWGVAPATLLYAGFTAFTTAAVLERRPIQSCGCFGREDTPPSRIHIAYNAIAAGSLGWVATTGGEAIRWADPLDQVILYLLFGALGAYASYVLLAVLPRTLELTAPK